MTVIVTKNSSTASSIPTSADLVQGELAVNVADKRLFTEDNAAAIIEIGTNPTSITTGAITASGTFTANGQFINANALLTGGTVNGIVIGASSAQAITGTVITANTNFVGALTGDTTGTHTGPVSGVVTGSLSGNVTSSSGTTTLHDLVINGTVDFNAAELTDIADPTSAQSAATRSYVDTRFTNLIDGAPAALDTLNELAAAMADDASFHTTVTNSIATKLPLAGGTMSGAIAMGTSKITGLGDGTATADAVNKGQLDAMMPLAGGTFSGNVVLGSNSITSTATPGTADTLTRKGYVDGILGSATSAATSAAAALVSENNAATSEANAATSATSAASSSTSAASSLADFNTKYLGAHATAPTGTAAGQQYFNTTSDTMFVYTGSSWTEAGSAVNGTSNRVVVTATAAQTDFSISYDVGYVDVYLNGSKLQAGTDFTATNGATVVLTSGAAAGDIVDMVAYGAFNVANVYTQTESDARFAQLSNNLSDLASASTALTNLGLTADAAEINKLDGMTSSKAELNVLTGIPATLTPTEVGYLDGVTSNIQTQINNVGGGNEASFVADGAISSKAPVILKSDGKAEAISQTTISTAAGTPALIDASGSVGGDYPSMCYHEAEDCVVLGFSDTDNNYYGTIVCGTIDSATKTITWDWSNRLVHYSTVGQLAYYHSLVYSQRGGNNRVGVFFRGNSNYGHCQVISVSGTTPSTTGAIQQFSNNYMANYTSAGIDSTTSSSSTVMLSYFEAQGAPNNKSFLRAFEVGSSSMSYGSEFDMTSSMLIGEQSAIVYHTPTSQFCIFNRDENGSYYGKMATITSSGTTISSVNNVVTYSSSSTYNIAADYSTDDDKFLLGYADVGDSYKGKCFSVSLSGTTLSLGGASATTFYNDNIGSLTLGICYSPTAKKFAVVYHDYGIGDDQDIKIATLSSSDYTVTLSAATELSSNGGYYSEMVYDPDTGLIATLYQDADNLDFYTTAIEVGYDSTNLTSTNFLGIADAAISDTATGTVILEGAVIEGLSSLTIGSTYYVLPTGALSTSAGTPSVTLGMAISATAINMRGAT